MRAMNEKIIAGFRSGASLGGMPKERMLLLTTTGAKTGASRTAPMMFVRPEAGGPDRLIVVASNSGAAHHPGWYYNLVANPQVTVELAEGTRDATARVLAGEEYERMWGHVVAQIPMYNDHQAKTSRTIPLVELRLEPAQ